MFWSLVLEPGKRYSSVVSESFHLSMATLDTKTCKNDTEVCPVVIEVDGCERILCNLSKSLIPQSSLDLVFEKGSDITFYTNGKATIHLTGYCIQDEAPFDEDDFSTSSSEEESSSELVNAKNASDQLKLGGKSKNIDKQNANKRKQNSAEAVSKKKQKKNQDESDEDDSNSGDSSVDVDDSKLDQLMESVNTEGDTSDEEDSELDDEEDADDSEDNDDDEDDDDDDDEEDEDDDDDDESEDEKLKPKPSTKQEIKTPISNKQKTPISNKKQDKQQNKSQLTNGVTPQSNKKDKNKNQANQPTPKQDGQKTPNKDSQKTPKKGEPSPAAQRKQTLSGGVVVEDLKPGYGPPAKHGKTVRVYYTGSLKSNGRVFDKTVDGPGFKFRLGNGEVIKGWDIALNGMKVGSKRRITIPPAMAYGNKGSPPAIPPNSWLVFDVEMKAVN